MEVTLKLEMDEVNIVLTSLSKMPYQEVAPLVQKVVEQGETQVKALEAAELAEGGEKA